MNIGQGAWQGAAGGMAMGGIMWGMNTLRTKDFIKNHVKFSDQYTSEQKAAVVQSIKESGQSPSGERLMARFMRAGTKLNLFPESLRPDGISAPGVMPGTNDMYFNGNFGSFVIKLISSRI